MEPDLEGGPTAGAPAGVPIKREIIVLVFVLSAVLLVSIVGGYLISSLDVLVPTFSVEVSGGGLDGGKPAPTLNATFNLTLRGVSRRRLIWSNGMCQERGAVSVSYAGAVLAWGRVPRFCVPAHAHKDVRMVAHGGGVALSDELRDRLATERLSQAAELDVDMMLDRWRLLSCRVKLDQPSPQQPSPCKVFAITYL